MFFLLVLSVLLLFPLAAFAADFKEHRTASGPFDVAWFEAGKDGVPLVFVHGWCGDHTAWEYQTAFFATSHRILAVDLPGHGASSAPDVPYTMDAFVTAVSDVMAAAEIDKAVLVGQSLGAEVCRRFAERFPERTAAVVLVEGAFVFPPESEEDRKALQAEYDNLAAGFGGASHDESMRTFVGLLWVPETPEKTREKFLSLMTGTSPIVARRAMDDLLRVDHWVDLPAVTVPALAVYAGHTAETEPGLEVNLRKYFADLRYEEVAKGYHFVMHENPDEVNARIDAFLKDLR